MPAPPHRQAQAGEAETKQRQGGGFGDQLEAAVDSHVAGERRREPVGVAIDDVEPRRISECIVRGVLKVGVHKPQRSSEGLNRERRTR